MSILMVEGFGWCFGEIYVFRDFDVSVEEGFVLGLFGLNGVGKIMMINFFLGFLILSSGCCFVDGIDVVEDFVEVCRCLGYVLEMVVFYLEFLGFENFCFFVGLIG